MSVVVDLLKVLSVKPGERTAFIFGKYFDEVMRLDRGRVRYKMLPRVTSNALSCSIIHCSFIHVSVDREQKMHYWNRRTKTC